MPAYDVTVGAGDTARGVVSYQLHGSLGEAHKEACRLCWSEKKAAPGTLFALHNRDSGRPIYYVTELKATEPSAFHEQSGLPAQRRTSRKIDASEATMMCQSSGARSM